MVRRSTPYQKDSEDAVEMMEDTEPLADQLISEQAESEKIKDAVQSLPEKQRIAIVLCYFEEMSNKEAAQIMEINIKALEGLLVRARKTLKGLLG